MPKVIHDLNLRNVAGRVCYQIADGTLLFLNPATRKLEGLRSNPKAYEDLRLLGGAVAGSTKLLLDNFLFPQTEDILTETTDTAWLRLPFNELWIDVKNIMSVLFMTIPEDASYVYDNDPDRIPRAILFVFFHRSSRAAKKITGCRQFSYLSFIGTVWKDIGEYGDWGISGAKFGKLDYVNYLINNDKEGSQLMKNSFFRIFYEVCFALNMLNNVSCVLVAPANKVPKSQRKWPQLQYHVLKIISEQRTQSSSLKEQLRQSPRQHLRRGHLRRLTDPKFTKPYTWIPPCIVGDAERGSIVKDYLL